jgi:hypothetical protein
MYRSKSAEYSERFGEFCLEAGRRRTQLWRLVCTAQQHKGGGRRPGDSRGPVHAKRQSEHRTGVGSMRSKREKIARKFNNTDMET